MFEFKAHLLNTIGWQSSHLKYLIFITTSTGTAPQKRDLELDFQDRKVSLG